MRGVRGMAIFVVVVVDVDVVDGWVGVPWLIGRICSV